MDKLEAVRIAARHLDQCGDEELNARTQADKAAARKKMIAAEREYAAALDALHDGKAAQGLDRRQMA